jgi:hypothetical protein
MRPLLLLLLATALVAPATPSLAQDDALSTSITIGRLPVLIDRAGGVLSGSPEAASLELAEDDDAGSLYLRLYAAWLDLEGLRAQACGAKILEGSICAHRFEPGWLRPPGSFAPQLADVTAWAEDLQGEVLNVIGPICALAPDSGDGPGACSVE